MPEMWLDCSVLKGMFSSERAVRCQKLFGPDFSTFVPTDLVRGDINMPGAVKVHAFQDAGTFWAVLPSPTGDTIPVLESHLHDSF